MPLSKRMLFGACALLTAVPVTAVLAQVGDGVGQPFEGRINSEAAPPQSIAQDEATLAFIQATKKRNAAVERQLSQKVGAAEIAGLNGYVRALNILLPNPSFVTDGALKDGPNEVFLTEVAQRTSALGFKVGDLRGKGKDGEEIAKAAAASIRGESTLSQEMLLADNVFVGEVVSYTEVDQRSDPYNSTVLIRVTNSLKGVGNGEEIEVRQVTGNVEDRFIYRSSELRPKAGEIVFGVVSVDAYRNTTKAADRGRGGTPTSIATTGLFYVRNGQILNEESLFNGSSVPSRLN